MTALLLSLALLVVPAQSGVVSDVSDSAITTRIKTVIGVNPHVNTFSIHVTTNAGVVTLAGRVEDETQRKIAEDIARETRGVVDVQNELTIIPTTITEKEERGFKQRASDDAVAANVRARMVMAKEGKGLKIGVTVVNGVATLHGVCNSEDQKTNLGKVAENTKGVVSVTNNLVIRTKENNGFFGNLSHNASDEWLESKIESAILFTRKLSVRDIDVEVDDGVCYLSGVVNNEEQKKVAGDIAAGYKGIHEVNNSITVREDGVDLAPEPRKPKGKPVKNTHPHERIRDMKEGDDAKAETKAEQEEHPAGALEPAPDAQGDGGLKEIEPTDEPSPKVEERTLEPPK